MDFQPRLPSATSWRPSYVWFYLNFQPRLHSANLAPGLHSWRLSWRSYDHKWMRVSFGNVKADRSRRNMKDTPLLLRIISSLHLRTDNWEWRSSWTRSMFQRCYGRGAYTSPAAQPIPAKVYKGPQAPQSQERTGRAARCTWFSFPSSRQRIWWFRYPRGIDCWIQNNSYGPSSKYKYRHSICVHLLVTCSIMI